MGFAVRRFVGVIALCLSINALLCSGRKKKQSSDALFECVLKQTCDCDKPQRFGDCYGQLTEQSQNWMVDQLNSCNLVELEYGLFTEGMQKLCSVANNEFKPCFDESNTQLMKRYVSTLIYLL
ncbi:hypothetical protein AVEN_48563-1 [Araneus ventricosus]|uniref:Uncharacterized protein n=1 Tax=Araneus ventricosus TaxID=182803 RepID=A0A4Y2TRQ4_ARAVE|nr:hypothetical protein AVEN_48563-1 [Araneus ventricosus]